jgi:hypothetical protein
VRTPCLLALCCALVVGCSSPREAGPADSATFPAQARGPDPLVLRIPIGGGTPRAVAYPSLDSVVWSGYGIVPALDRILAFDDNDGTFSFVDTRGRPGRLDLRGDSATIVSRDAFASITSSSGTTIAAATRTGVVWRYTPGGDWSVKTEVAARQAFAQRDGAVLVLSGRGGQSVLTRLRPPSPDAIDTVALPEARFGVATSVGDRLYFATKQDVVAVDTRTFEASAPIAVGNVTAMATTPSGDRIFVTLDSARQVKVIDRYRARVAATFDLPRPPGDLRVDPLGRFVLVRDVQGDSVWVVAIGNDRVVATIASRWRGDLPHVAPDGGILTLQGKDVVAVDPLTGATRQRVAGGAADFWHSFWWTGFRAPGSLTPDSSVLALPVGADSSALAAVVDSTLPKRDTIVPPPPGFMLQFGAFTAEQMARDTAAVIHAGGVAARVTTSLDIGIPVYRIVMGPFPTKEEAERVGLASGRPFCVVIGAVCK